MVFTIKKYTQIKSIRSGLRLLAILFVAVSVSGCELLSSFNTQSLRVANFVYDTTVPLQNFKHLKNGKDKKDSGNIWVEPKVSAEIFYVPKTLTSAQGDVFISNLKAFIKKQARSENLSVVIKIFTEGQMDAAEKMKNALISIGVPKIYIAIKIEKIRKNTIINNQKVLIVSEYYKIFTPKCPNWNSVNGADFSNFGCSTAVNYAVHIRNPRDLIVGRKLAPAPSAPYVNAINTYYGTTVYSPVNGMPATGMPATGTPAKGNGVNGSTTGTALPNTGGATGTAGQ